MLEILAQSQSNPLVSFAPLILIGIVFYFLLIRPQQRKAREQRELLAAVDVGDEIVTTSGLLGTIVEVDDDNPEVIIIEIADGIEVRMLRAGVARRVTDDIDTDDDDHEAIEGQVGPIEEQ
jgi:preprotein translocase subunit YajC